MIREHVGVIFNVCLLDFYTTQILTSMTVSIECISWLIKVTNNNDEWWKPEITLDCLLAQKNISPCLLQCEQMF